MRSALSGLPVAAVFAACTFGTAAVPAPPAIDAAMGQPVIDGAFEHPQCGDTFADADGAGDQSLYRHKLGRIAPDIGVDSAEALREVYLDTRERIRPAAADPEHGGELDPRSQR